MSEGLCQYPNCWRFPYLSFHFCIKHKCQNHRCNSYKVTDHEYCSFHKCSFEFCCPNPREFLQYQKGPQHLPIYSKFCAVHNRNPVSVDRCQYQQLVSLQDDEFTTDSDFEDETSTLEFDDDDDDETKPLIELMYINSSDEEEISLISEDDIENDIDIEPDIEPLCNAIMSIDTDSD